MMDLLKKIEHNGKTIEFHVDEDTESPREWSNLGTIVYSPGSRHTLGDKTMYTDEMESIMRNVDDYIHLPVYAYIHSEIALNTTGFTCPWDSGQSGIIYVSKADVRKEYKKQRISTKLEETVCGVLRQEIATFSQYLEGDVYGFIIKDKDGGVIDSCCGFYGMEHCEQEAISMAS